MNPIRRAITALNAKLSVSEQIYYHGGRFVYLNRVQRFKGDFSSLEAMCIKMIDIRGRA